MLLLLLVKCILIVLTHSLHHSVALFYRYLSRCPSSFIYRVRAFALRTRVCMSYFFVVLFRFVSQFNFAQLKTTSAKIVLSIELANGVANPYVYKLQIAMNGDVN